MDNTVRKLILLFAVMFFLFAAEETLAARKCWIEKGVVECIQEEEVGHVEN